LNVRSPSKPQTDLAQRIRDRFSGLRDVVRS